MYWKKGGCMIDEDFISDELVEGIKKGLNESEETIALPAHPGVELYRLQRTISRLIKAIALICPSFTDRKAFNIALKNIIRDEKLSLLNLLFFQMESLQNVGAPDFLIENKKNDYARVNDFLNSGRFPQIDEKLIASLNDEKQQDNELLDLSTNFVCSRWPIELGADDDVPLKTLLET
jgi:hypothetical protein